MSNQKIPTEIWKAACENIREPLVIVGLDNKFIWVNKAFEQFTGYPVAELLTKSWLDITARDDIGSDLASRDDIIKGQSISYAMDKKYIHRRGHEIDATIIVRRWPNEPEAIIMFYVEAIPPTISKNDLDNIIRELTGRIIHIEAELPKAKSSVPLRSNDSENESQKIKYFAIGFLALIGMIMYLFYCLVMLQLQKTPEAPNNPMVEKTINMIDTSLCLDQ